MNWLIAVVVILMITTVVLLEDKIFDDAVSRLVVAASHTPYFHLHHGDDSLYMERYWIVPFASAKEGCYIATWRKPVVWLLQMLGVSIRLHVIHTPDLDRAMHDHPWTFASFVLRGWYDEERPLVKNSATFVGDAEETVLHRRERGSFALRRFFHRHRIAAVSPGGVITLFISLNKRQSWGFYTPEGKVWWWKFESVHNTKPITAKPYAGADQREPDLYVGD